MTSERELFNVLKRAVDAYYQGDHKMARKWLEWVLAELARNAAEKLRDKP